MNNDIAPALQLTGGTVVLGPAFQNGGAITNLILNGATLSGTNTVTGALTILGGALNGVLTVNSNATLSFTSNQFTLVAGAITNSARFFAPGTTSTSSLKTRPPCSLSTMAFGWTRAIPISIIMITIILKPRSSSITAFSAKKGLVARPIWVPSTTTAWWMSAPERT